jgi:hypothetical protein
VESFLTSQAVTFEILRTRLLVQVKQRIDNGEFTERGLARILGISQSQTHNVLKGARFLQIQLADRMLTKLGISVVDLLHEHELTRVSALEIAKWSREMAMASEDGNLVENDVVNEALLALKMPAARSETGSNRDVRKTG